MNQKGPDFVKLPIDEIALDYDNPRIQLYLKMYKCDPSQLTSDQISLALNNSGDTKNTTYDTLTESIKTNRGIINPIIVNCDTSTNKKTVIEGNTRLQIYKELRNSDPNGPWNEIICAVYKDLPQKDIDAIRLQSHLVGPRDWDPYSKARYLHRLSHVDYMPLSEIVSFCGGKQNEIRKLIDAYVDMENYYRPLVEEIGDQVDPKQFSKFAELQNSSLANSLSEHHFSKTNFAKWVLDGKIDTAQSVRKLRKVLADKKACESFLRDGGTVEKAEKIIETSSLTSNEKLLEELPIETLARILREKLEKIQYSEIQGMKGNNPHYQGEKDELLQLQSVLEETIEGISE